METLQPELIATPQFDSGRWKLRLERVPIATDKKFTAPLVSSVAVGFTTPSPLIFLIAAYLWGDVCALRTPRHRTKAVRPRAQGMSTKISTDSEMSIFKCLRK
jgi:hypothetical protein